MPPKLKSTFTKERNGEPCSSTAMPQVLQAIRNMTDHGERERLLSNFEDAMDGRCLDSVDHYESQLVLHLDNHGYTRDYVGVALRVLAGPPKAKKTFTKLASAMYWHVKRTTGYSYNTTDVAMMGRLIHYSTIKSGTQPKEIGSVSPQQFAQLQEVIALHGKNWYDTWTVYAKYELGIRAPSETSTATFDQLGISRGRCVFETGKIHVNSEESRGEVETHYLPLEFYAKACAQRRELVRRGLAPDYEATGQMLICHGWTNNVYSTHINSLITIAAKRHKWNPDFRWTAHSLRHGIAGAAAEGLTGDAAVAAAQQRTGHNSAACATHYSRSMKQRIQRAGRQQAQTAKAQAHSARRTELKQRLKRARAASNQGRALKE